MRDSSDFPRFSREEMADRHDRARAVMDDTDVDALLVYGAGRFSSEIYWLTDWPGSREAYVLFPRDGAPVVLLQLYNHVPMARVLSVIVDVRWAGANTGDGIAALIGEQGLADKRIGLVGGVPYRQYLKIRDVCADGMLKDVSGPFRLMRTVRSAEELDRMRFASALTDRSMQAIAEGLEAGMMECEIPALIEPVYLQAGGYAGIHFMSSMSMREPDFPVPAQYQSRRRLEPGDCLITEISGAYWGYTGQIHRTFSLGEAPTPEWADLHACAVDAFMTLADLIRDGVSTREVEEAADLIHARGYGIYDDLLHGANQYPPIIQTARARRYESPEVIFRKNMVITIQPNVITDDERMGLQFGETLVVGKDGCMSLNAFPREWIVCRA